MGIINFIANNIYLAGKLDLFIKMVGNPLEVILWGLYSLFILIAGLFYTTAAYAYTLFPLMAYANFGALFGDISNIINRIEIFIGVVMLFVVAFGILQYLVSPDKNGSVTSKLAMRIVVGLALLVSSNFIFGLFDDLQNAMVGYGSDNLIETILGGNSNLSGAGNGATTAFDSYLDTGRAISYSVFLSMYENKCAEPKDEKRKYSDLDSCDLSGRCDGCEYNCKNGNWTNRDKWGNVLNHLSSCTMDRMGDGDEAAIRGGYITYEYPLFDLFVAVVMIVVFVLFAVDIGIRNISLMFIRVLFPIAALGYMIPGQKGTDILTKYIRAYISTYVELFIKIFSLYLIFYIFLWFLDILFHNSVSISDIFGTGIEDKGLIKVLLMLLFLVALFMFFFKGLPKLLSDIFGLQMNSTLSSVFGKALGVASAGLGLAAGGIAGAIAGGRKGGGFGGAMRGLASGAKRGATGMYASGKSLAAGNLKGAFEGTKGTVNNTKAGVVAGRGKAMADRQKRRDNAADRTAKNADKKNKGYEMRQRVADKYAAEAAKFDENDHSPEAEFARKRAELAKEQADKWKGKAGKKDKKAVLASKRAGRNAVGADGEENPNKFHSRFGNDDAKTGAEKRADRKTRKQHDKDFKAESKYAEKIDAKADRQMKNQVVDADYEVIGGGAAAGAVAGAVAGGVMYNGKKAPISAVATDMMEGLGGGSAQPVKVETQQQQGNSQPVKVETQQQQGNSQPVKVETQQQQGNSQPVKVEVQQQGGSQPVQVNAQAQQGNAEQTQVNVQTPQATMKEQTINIGGDVPVSGNGKVVVNGEATTVSQAADTLMSDFTGKGSNSSTATVSGASNSVNTATEKTTSTQTQTRETVYEGGGSSGESRTGSGLGGVVNKIIGNEAPASNSQRMDAGSSQPVNVTINNTSTPTMNFDGSGFGYGMFNGGGYSSGSTSPTFNVYNTNNVSGATPHIEPQSINISGATPHVEPQTINVSGAAPHIESQPANINYTPSDTAYVNIGGNTNNFDNSNKGAETIVVNTVDGVGGGMSQTGFDPKTGKFTDASGRTTEFSKPGESRMDADEAQRGKDALIEKLINERTSDLRAHAAGERTEAKINELMKQGKNALDATKEAYKEAEEFINKRIDELMKVSKMTREEALAAAKKEWNEQTE